MISWKKYSVFCFKFIEFCSQGIWHLIDHLTKLNCQWLFWLKKKKQRYFNFMYHADKYNDEIHEMFFMINPACDQQNSPCYRSSLHCSGFQEFNLGPDSISMAKWKTAVTPLLMHWSYPSLTLGYQYKDVLPCILIPIINRTLWEHLIFLMGIPIIVRWHLYIEWAPGSI